MVEKIKNICTEATEKLSELLSDARFVDSMEVPFRNLSSSSVFFDIELYDLQAKIEELARSIKDSMQLRKASTIVFLDAKAPKNAEQSYLCKYKNLSLMCIQHHSIALDKPVYHIVAVYAVQ